MRIQLPKVTCRYGAPMGRHNPTDMEGKCKLQKCPMVDGGAYDTGGAYWGHGTTLWVCQDIHGDLAFVRAVSREIAKETLRTIYPDIEFVR